MAAGAAAVYSPRPTNYPDIVYWPNRNSQSFFSKERFGELMQFHTMRTIICKVAAMAAAHRFGFSSTGSSNAKKKSAPLLCKHWQFQCELEWFIRAPCAIVVDVAATVTLSWSRAELVSVCVCNEQYAERSTASTSYMRNDLSFFFSALCLPFVWNSGNGANNNGIINKIVLVRHKIQCTAQHLNA